MIGLEFPEIAFSLFLKFVFFSVAAKLTSLLKVAEYLLSLPHQCLIVKLKLFLVCGISMCAWASVWACGGNAVLYALHFSFRDSWSLNPELSDVLDD